MLPLLLPLRWDASLDGGGGGWRAEVEMSSFWGGVGSRREISRWDELSCAPNRL